MNVKVINVGGVVKPWFRLLTHLKNSIPHSFRLVFSDETSARKAAKGMGNSITDQPQFAGMVVCRRGCEVYVIKTDFAQKVVIRDEPGGT